MGDVVNLRTVRKRAKRQRAEQEAHANRLAHGRPRSERTRVAAEQDQIQRNLDQHRIEPGDGQ